MYHTTGFDRDDILDITERIHHHCTQSGKSIGHPPMLGLFDSVRVTLTYLRRNTRQAELAEYFDCSQSTISRAISAITPWIEHALSGYVPTADELSPDDHHIVDGTLVPCWSWADHPELYSGKHKTTGLNLQVVCSLNGHLRFVSDPHDGCRHDVAALDESTILDRMPTENWIGDKGYIGRGMLTPIRKPSHRALLDWENEFNTAINKIRWVVERAIANLKTWRILHIDYRRPYETFATTIAAVIALEFFKQNAE